jgi:hypothetical protein
MRRRTRTAFVEGLHEVIAERLARGVAARDSERKVNGRSRIVWGRNPRTRKVAVGLTGILLTFAVMAGLAHAGGRYFYCEAMQLMQSDPCVATHDDKGAGSKSTFCAFRTDCCEMWTLPSMPAGTAIAQDHVVAPPGLVALVPATDLLLQQSETSFRARSRVLERWRSPPRPPGELRTQLMVFLT